MGTSVSSISCSKDANKMIWSFPPKTMSTSAVICCADDRKWRHHSITNPSLPAEGESVRCVGSWLVKLAHVHREQFGVSLDADGPSGSLPSSPCRRRLLFCITGSLQAPARCPKMRPRSPESTEAGRRRTNSEWWSAWSSPLYCPCSASSSSSELVSGRVIQKKKN